MLIHPWDAATDDTEWDRWLREGRDFGQLVVNGAPGQPPHVMPTPFVLDGPALLVHLARSNPAWPALHDRPQVVMAVTDDYATSPAPGGPRSATPTKTAFRPATTPPSSSPARRKSSTTPMTRPNCSAASSPTSSRKADTPAWPPASRPTAGCSPASAA